jgi:D-mannonate dehydratase
MNELRNKLIDIFSKMEDKPYLSIAGKMYTTKQLIDELEFQTVVDKESIREQLPKFFKEIGI